jgi:hypothetical protein
MWGKDKLSKLLVWKISMCQILRNRKIKTPTILICNLYNQTLVATFATRNIYQYLIWYPFGSPKIFLRI